jgi:hypothetical protein
MSMGKRLLFSLLCGVVLFALISGVAMAQSTNGSLRGEVTDAQGGTIPDAKVIATNQDTGVAYTTATTSAGVYSIADLPVGMYTVTIEKTGFEKYVRSGVQVFANQVAEAHAKLAVGPSTTTIEVTAGAEVVQTTTSQISNDFDARAVNELPSLDLTGSPLNLAILAPGTTTQGGGVLGEGGSIGGARPRLNNFTIDGVDDNRQDITGHETPIIQDAVAEFNLVTNQFGADIGHSAGGQFNIITKTGTNQFHGDAFMYNQNRHYNAMDNLDHLNHDTQPPRFDFSRAGGAIGGPILHDKLFFFGAYQRTWEGLATSAVSQTVPTSAGLAQLVANAANPAVVAILNQFPTAPTASTTALLTTVPANTNGTCSAGCMVEFGTISPVAPNFGDSYDFNVNMDASLGKHQLSGRYLFDRFRAPNVNSVTPASQFTGSQVQDVRKFLFHDGWVVSGRFLNDFRGSFSRLVLGFTVPSTLSNFPNAEIDTFGLNIGPQGCSPQSNIINTYQLLDNMSLVRGRHNFKWGAEWRHWISPGNFLPRARGEWDYADISRLVNDEVPNGLNGALRGAGSGFFAGNQNAAYLFAMDDIKVSARLTVNVGLRYEWTGIPRDDSLQNLNSISNGVFIFRTPKADIDTWEPRIGFAYDPFGNGKWAVRGGFGISYDVTPLNFPLLSLPPQKQTEQNPGLTCSLPGPPAWCASFSSGGPGDGFLAGGGLNQVNVPCADQITCRQSTSGIILDQVQPEVLTWSLGVQHELYRNASFEVRYLGTRSYSLPVQVRLNTESGFDAGLQPLPTFFSASQVPATLPTTGPRRSDFTTFLANGNASPCLPGGYIVNAATNFCGLVTGFPPIGSGTYHGVSADYFHRLGHNLSLRANYTFEHNIDNATNELFSSRVNPRRTQDGNHVSQDRGNSVLDVPHKLAVSWVYEIPGFHGGNGFLHAFTNGWQWSGAYLAQSGQPVTILSGTDSNANGDSAGDRAILNPSGTGNTGTGVNQVCVDPTTGATSIAAACPGGGSTVAGYVAVDPTARYVQAGRGARSTLGRNSFRSPGVNVWDMSIGKTTTITERFKVQFRADAIDVFNHRNFSIAQPSVFEPVVNNALSTTYTNVTAHGSGFLDAGQFSGGSRNLQLVLKLIF